MTQPTLPLEPSGITRCYGKEYLALCQRALRGEIWIFDVRVGKSNAQWIVSWALRKPKYENTDTH